MLTLLRLQRLRDQAVAARASLPTEPELGAVLTDLIDEIDRTSLEIVQSEPEPEEPPKPVVMPERFDYDAFLLDLMLPRNQMRVWDAAGIWS